MAKTLREWAAEEGIPDEKIQEVWEQVRRAMLPFLEADQNDEDALRRFRETPMGRLFGECLRDRRSLEEKQAEASRTLRVHRMIAEWKRKRRQERGEE